MASPNLPFFTGHFRHALDDKNRVTIPSSWRAAHGEKAVFLAIPSTEGYITVLPPAEVQKLYDKVAQVPLSDASGQAAMAAFFSKTQAFSFDKQGRLGLSDTLLKHAGLTKEVVLSGGFTNFNLMSPEKWAAVEGKSDQTATADFLRRFGI